MRCSYAIRNIIALMASSSDNCIDITADESAGRQQHMLTTKFIWLPVVLAELSKLNV